MNPAALLKFAVPLILLSLLALLIGMWLFKMQKKNRKFEKKGVIYYSIVGFLLLAVFGLLGAAFGKDSFGQLFLWGEIFVLIFGITHTWLTFSNFTWSDPSSWGPETLFTLYIGLVSSIGILTGFKLASRFLGAGQMNPLELLPVMIVFPLPYLAVRTYHYLLQIPHKVYSTWRFPNYPAPKIDLRTENVIFVQIRLLSSCQVEEQMEIIQRTRYPRNSTFSDFFQNFVSDYNKEREGRQITCLNENSNKQAIGWNFYVQKGKRGRKMLLDPWEVGLGLIEEGDYLLAVRVALDEKAIFDPPASPSITIIEDGPDEPDSDIIFTEKG